MDLNIKKQIQEEKKRREELKKQKKENEDKVKNGEGILDALSTYRKEAKKAVSDFEDELNARCSEMPESFGNYYRRKIQAALEKTDAYEADNMASDICTAIKNAILDLENVIKAIKGKIEEINNWLRSIMDKFEDAKEFIGDLF